MRTNQKCRHYERNVLTLLVNTYTCPHKAIFRRTCMHMHPTTTSFWPFFFIWIWGTSERHDFTAGRFCNFVEKLVPLCLVCQLTVSWYSAACVCLTNIRCQKKAEGPSITANITSHQCYSFLWNLKPRGFFFNWMHIVWIFDKIWQLSCPQWVMIIYFHRSLRYK